MLDMGGSPDIRVPFWWCVWQELSVYDDTATILDMLHSQARGLVLPRHARLCLWLAARRRVWNTKDEERLSVSRIGERHVASHDDYGNVVIEATGPLWPVLCHYLMLSVDQEERLRSALIKLGARMAGSQEQQLRESLQMTDQVYEQLNSSVLFTKQKMEDLSNVLDPPQLEALMRWAERRRLQQIAKEKRPSHDSPTTTRKYRSSNEQSVSLEQFAVEEQRQSSG
jgi:hypothetical protein